MSAFLPTPPPSPRDSLDLRVILLAPVRQFVPWLAIVLLVTWAGYPGIACITPMAWLIALRLGIDCANRSQSPFPGSRLREAALAGAWFGALQGLLFWLIAPRMGPVLPTEQREAGAIIAIILLAGAVVSAGFSTLAAWWIEQRRRNEI